MYIKISKFFLFFFVGLTGAIALNCSSIDAKNYINISELHRI